MGYVAFYSHNAAAIQPWYTANAVVPVFLIVARAVQGVAGALLVPSSLALITATFAGPARGRAIGIWTGLTSVAMLIGPGLGGVFVDFLSWRLVFLVNVLPIAVTLVLLQLLRHRETRQPGARLDLPPLRDRSEDLFAIMQALAANRQESYDPSRVEVESIERMMLHPWSRDVRELAATLEKVAALAPPPQLPHWAVEKVLGPLSIEGPAPLTQETVERALQACDGNESAAARKLGITRARLRRFLKKA